MGVSYGTQLTVHRVLDPTDSTMQSLHFELQGDGH